MIAPMSEAVLEVPRSWKALPWLAAVTKAGGKAYAVGGAVRDLFAGGEPQDLDVVVTGVPGEKLRSMLAACGKVDRVGEHFAIYKWKSREAFVVDVALPRRERSTGPGHRDFEIEACVDLSVEDDLARRDFTINAMALALPDGKMIDPHDGRRDFHRNRLRAVGDAGERFREDPLRMLRGVAFVARFVLDVEVSTREAMKRCAPLIATVSEERIATELAKLLSHAKKPSRGLSLMVETGLLVRIIPEFRASIGFDQMNPYHHLPLDQHVFAVVDECCRRGANLAVRIAALFHDIAKPTCRSEERDAKGRVVAHFFGHEEESAKMAASIFDRLRLSAAQEVPAGTLETALQIIRHHRVDLEALQSERALRRWIRRVGGSEVALQVLEHHQADRFAHAPGFDRVELGDLRARIRAASDVPVTDHVLALDGRAIGEIFGLEGKSIGRLKHDLLDLIVAGDCPNEKEALITAARKILAR